MAYTNLWEFIEFLRKRNHLVEIDEPLAPELEISTLAERVMKKNGPALLFRNPQGYALPVVVNLLGDAQRMAWALGVEHLDQVVSRLENLIDTQPPATWSDRLSALPKLKAMSEMAPREIRGEARCQAVQMSEPDLTIMPHLKTWPLDGGRYITLPQVITADPDSGQCNVGMYRMQIYDATTAGMHWHIHKGGAQHYRQWQRRGQHMPAAVVLGGDPVLTYVATAPLPDDFNEYHFAGLLRQKRVDVVKCLTNDLRVPADAEIVIEGYVDKDELRREGPFGDHTGYYSLADDFPVFHVTAITHAPDPVYPATLVGPPPMEDRWIGKATERLFLPMLKKLLPEIVDMNLPMEGCFHSLCLVRMRKSYPGHARKIASALWGLGQLSFCKIIIIVDEEVDVQNPAEVVWRVTNNIAPERDCFFSWGPIDMLDHASEESCYGSKLGIDATRKLPEEGFRRQWPPDIKHDPEVLRKIESLLPKLGLDIPGASR